MAIPRTSNHAETVILGHEDSSSTHLGAEDMKRGQLGEPRRHVEWALGHP